MTLEQDSFSEEKYTLFEQYQRLIHKESPAHISKNGFKRFLCDSPLVRVNAGNEETKPLGSYHQCYRLDGKLIALTVLDLLPRAVSAVYSIYDVDYEKWSFGKLTALRELAMAAELGYELYYMGFYIHECPKMRYKGEYRPQEILDPRSNKWYPFDDKLKAKLDESKFPVFEDDEGNPAPNPPMLYATPSQAEQSQLPITSLNIPGVKHSSVASQETNLENMYIGIQRNDAQVIQAKVRLLHRQGNF